MTAVERKPQVLAPVPDEYIGPNTDWTGITRASSQLVWRLVFPEATSEGP